MPGSGMAAPARAGPTSSPEIGRSDGPRGRERLRPPGRHRSGWRRPRAAEPAAPPLDRGRADGVAGKAQQAMVEPPIQVDRRAGDQPIGAVRRETGGSSVAQGERGQGGQQPRESARCPATAARRPIEGHHLKSSPAAMRQGWISPRRRQRQRRPAEIAQRRQGRATRAREPRVQRASSRLVTSLPARLLAISPPSAGECARAPAPRGPPAGRDGKDGQTRIQPPAARRARAPVHAAARPDRRRLRRPHSCRAGPSERARAP